MWLTLHVGTKLRVTLPTLWCHCIWGVGSAAFCCSDIVWEIKHCTHLEAAQEE